MDTLCHHLVSANRRRFAWIILTPLLCPTDSSPVYAGPRPSADFYVAPWGNDNNPGSAAQPFATLTRARDALRPIIAAGLTAPHTVLLHGGVYRLKNAITFGLPDSGTPDFSVTYAAYPGEHPIISGGEPIEGWTAQPNGTWTVTIPQAVAGGWRFRELFINGSRRPRARHPDAGFLRVASAAPNQRTTFSFYERDIPPETDLAGAELVFLHDWSISRVRIDHVDHAANLLITAEPIGAVAPIFAITYFTPHPRYFVEHDLVLLDSPGEWFLNELTGALTYRPMPAEEVGSIEAVAPVADEILVVRGDFGSSVPVRNLHFCGLTVEHCAWDLPSGGFAEYQAGFYEDRDPAPLYVLPAAVTFELVDACSFTEGSLAHLGGWGLMFGRSAGNCTITGNVVTDVAGNGLLIGEDRYRRIGPSQWWMTQPGQAASGNIVRNNLVERCGEVFFGCVGVWVGLANNVDVSHNLIRNLPQSGISVGGLWDPTPTPCFANSINDNHIHDVMLTLSDGGAVYTVGAQPGTRILRNLIHAIPPNAGSAQSNGIFCDQGSTSIQISSNALFSIARSPFKFHLAGINTVTANTLLLPNPTVEPFAYFNMNPANIVLLGNEVSVVSTAVACEYPVYQLLPDAGPEPEILSRLLTLPPTDGCQACAGVAYSGLTVDACGVCGGNGLSCAVPTLSQWGLTILTLMLLVAATIVFRRGRAPITEGRAAQTP